MRKTIIKCDLCGKDISNSEIGWLTVRGDNHKESNIMILEVEDGCFDCIDKVLDNFKVLEKAT